MKFLPFVLLAICIGCTSYNTSHWNKKILKSYIPMNDPFCDCNNDKSIKQSSRTYIDSSNFFKLNIDTTLKVSMKESKFDDYSLNRIIHFSSKTDTTALFLLHIETLAHPSDSSIQIRDSVLSQGYWQKINYSEDTLSWQASSSYITPGHWPNQKEVHKSYTKSLVFRKFHNKKWFSLTILTTNPTKDTYNPNFQCKFRESIETFTTF